MITYLSNMNHLAHLLLAGDDQALQLGAMLGDHVRGDVSASGFTAAVRCGIRLHRKIDIWTDHNPLISSARALFPAPYRRYAGILLDVYFDHLLSRQWAAHSALSLAAFNSRTLAMLKRHQASLPSGLLQFYRFAKATNVLARYGETAMLQQVFVGISQRFRHVNPLPSALPLLQQHDVRLQQTFAQFWPHLQQTSQHWLAEQMPISAADRHAAPPPRSPMKPGSDR